MRNILFATFFAAALDSGVASATDLHQEIVINAKPEQVWKQISDFCSIRYWAAKDIPKCSQYMKDGVHFRTLTLSDGTEIEEKLVDITDTSFSYSITKAEAPIKNHKATMALSLQSKTGNTVLSWDVHMTVDSDSKTQDAIVGSFQQIMKDGLQSIKTKVKASH